MSDLDLTVLNTIAVSTRRDGFKASVVTTGGYRGERASNSKHQSGECSDLPPQFHELIVEGEQYAALAKYV